MIGTMLFCRIDFLRRADSSKDSGAKNFTNLNCCKANPTGGVGLAAIEIGKILGATVFATVGSTEKIDAAKEHGADHVINYQDEDFRSVVNDLTGGIGANAIYDPVGGDVFAQSLRCVAPEGRIMPA